MGRVDCGMGESKVEKVEDAGEEECDEFEEKDDDEDETGEDVLVNNKEDEVNG